MFNKSKVVNSEIKKVQTCEELLNQGHSYEAQIMHHLVDQLELLIKKTFIYGKSTSEGR